MVWNVLIFVNEFVLIRKSEIMFKGVFSRLIFSNRYVINDSFKRFFLSNAYKCEEAWENRLKQNAFQKLDLSCLYHELDFCFLKNLRISALDIDLLINGFKNYSYKNELEDILLRLRLCPECVLLPERATHAAIRFYMEQGPAEDLLNVLSDRINYGLFPSHYLINLLMDKYLKEKDAKSAVKIAVLQMLQEDFDNPIMKVLALHCCYNYLESSEIWESYKQPEPDPDEEVVKVRVRYLRNPYFDDHFDITDTNHLVGKTLWLFGQKVQEAIGISSQLVGLVLYEKYNLCSTFLEEVIHKGIKLHAHAVAKAKEYSLEKPKQVKEEVKTQESKANSSQEEAKTEASDEWKNRVLDLLNKIDKDNLVEGNLLSESIEVVKRIVKENENKDIENQLEVYKQWEKEREDHIQNEIKRAESLKVKSEIEKIKAELDKEEERLFFFDNEEELMVKVQQKQKEMQSVHFYKGKGKHKEKVLDEYIPPEVAQKKN